MFKNQYFIRLFEYDMSINSSTSRGIEKAGLNAFFAYTWFFLTSCKESNQYKKAYKVDESFPHFVRDLVADWTRTESTIFSS